MPKTEFTTTTISVFMLHSPDWSRGRSIVEAVPKPKIDPYTNLEAPGSRQDAAAGPRQEIRSADVRANPAPIIPGSQESRSIFLFPQSMRCQAYKAHAIESEDIRP